MKSKNYLRDLLSVGHLLEEWIVRNSLNLKFESQLTDCEWDVGSNGGHGWAHVYDLDWDFNFLGRSDWAFILTLGVNDLALRVSPWLQ